MAKLRLGLIGTGLAARQLYLPAFARLSQRLTVVACANRTRKKAESYAKLAKIPKVVDGLDELLALPEVDAVLISLPIEQQPPMIKRALAAGKPVMSEKPLAPSVSVARRLLKATARYQVPWLVAENFAFMSNLEQVAAWVASGRIGEPRLLEAHQIVSMDRNNPYFHTTWRQKPRHVGGFVSDAGVHLAHAVRRVLGMPKVVRRLVARFDPALPPPDTALALFKFPSGALGTWASCFSAHHHGPMLRVYGSRGTAELGWDSARFVSPSGKEQLVKAKRSSFEAEFAHFCDVVLKGEPIAYTPAEALLDLKLIEQIVA